MGVVAAHVTRAPGAIPRWLRWVALAAGVAAIALVLPFGDAAPDGAVWPADLVSARPSRCSS